MNGQLDQLIGMEQDGYDRSNNEAERQITEWEASLNLKIVDHLPPISGIYRPVHVYCPTAPPANGLRRHKHPASGLNRWILGQIRCLVWCGRIFIHQF